MKRITIGSLVALATVAAATCAQAQMVVSNLGNSTPSGAIIGPIGGSTEGGARAQQFTTGSSGFGWTLNSLIFRLYESGNAPSSLTLQLYSTDGGGLPGSSLGTLLGSDPSGSSTATYTYYPAASISLADNTSYYAVLTASTSPVNYYVWRVTSDTTETADPGWSIADNSQYDPGAGWGVIGSQDPLLMSVQATAVPEPSTYALIAGLGLVGFAGYRRCRSRA